MWYRKNVPRWERVLRVALAVIVLAVFGVARGLAVASALAVTGFIGFCPACALMGRRLRDRTAL